MRQAFIEALDGLYESMGDKARHINRDGETRDCVVIWSADLEAMGESAQVNSIVATLKVRRAELADAPRRGEWFIVGDAEFKVAQMNTADELEYTVSVG